MIWHGLNSPSYEITRWQLPPECNFASCSLTKVSRFGGASRVSRNTKLRVPNFKIYLEIKNHHLTVAISPIFKLNFCENKVTMNISLAFSRGKIRESLFTKHLSSADNLWVWRVFVFEILISRIPQGFRFRDILNCLARNSFLSLYDLCTSFLGLNSYLLWIANTKGQSWYQISPKQASNCPGLSFQKTR